MNSKKTLLASLIALASIGQAFAADTDKPFDGSYFGASLGYGAGKSKVSSDLNIDSSPAAVNYFSATEDTQLNPQFKGTPKDQTWFGGLNIGHNIQVNKIVYGAELDLNSLNYDATRRTTGTDSVLTPDTFNNKLSVSADWLLTLKAKVGYAVDNSLFYLTGGVAATKLEISHDYTEDAPLSPASASSSDKDTKYGWTMGFGYEQALQNSWSVKAEYRYTEFNNVRGMTRDLVSLGTTYTDTFATRGDLSFQTIQIGISKYF